MCGLRHLSAAPFILLDAECAAESSGLTTFPIVGVGASAGGLDALRRLLAGLPREVGMAFVLVQHRESSHKSELVPLLAARCSLPVVEAASGLEVRANHVYVVPAGKLARLVDGAFVFSDRPSGVQHGVDDFL